MNWRDRWAGLREDPEHRAYVLAEEAKHTLAVRVHRMRTSRGMTQTALAAAVGTRQPNISAIETADANVTIETLGKLAAALDVAISDLFMIDDPAEAAGAGKPRRGAA